ncbi:MAG: hypothetical protein ACRD4U_00980 [Candidatus Acidiferrales bacterium]
MRRVCALPLLLAVACALLAPPLVGLAGEAWESKPASAWTQEEAVELLTKSPWAKQVTYWHASGRLVATMPDGSRVVVVDETGRQLATVGPPPPTPENPTQAHAPIPVLPELVDAEYALRWSSAKAVQDALGRLQEVSPAVGEMQAAPPELSSEHYVLTARVAKPPSETPTEGGFRRPVEIPQVNTDPERPLERQPPPKIPDLFAGLGEEELKARATLVTARKLQVKPARAVRHGLGTGEGISFFFPREVNGASTLPPGTAWAEFVFEGRKGDKLKARFKMKEMTYQGKQDY